MERNEREAMEWMNGLTVSSAKAMRKRRNWDQLGKKALCTFSGCVALCSDTFDPRGLEYFTLCVFSQNCYIYSKQSDEREKMNSSHGMYRSSMNEMPLSNTCAHSRNVHISELWVGNESCRCCLNDKRNAFEFVGAAAVMLLFPFHFDAHRQANLFVGSPFLCVHSSQLQMLCEAGSSTAMRPKKNVFMCISVANIKRFLNKCSNIWLTRCSK